MAENSEGALDAAVAMLASTLMADDVDLAHLLQRIAVTGQTIALRAESASITLLGERGPTTVASTSELALELDAAQYRDDAGPCLTAAREQRMVSIPGEAHHRAWGGFLQVAERLGVHAAMSVPIASDDRTAVAALNVYGRSADAFDDEDRRRLLAFAHQASALVANADAYWSALDQATHMNRAMATRARIEQAKGILMALHSCTAEQAFDMLRRTSQRDNRKLHDIADEVVDGVTQRGVVPTE